MVDFNTCTLQQAAAHGAALSTFFGKHVLNKPHKLEFEKVLFPCAFYRKKMYSALKYEGEYRADAEGELFARGLSAVRRDNALLVKNTVLHTMDALFIAKQDRAAIVADLGAILASVHNSAVAMHDPDRAFDGRLPFEHFIQSAGVSKDLANYDNDNAAVSAAKQLVALNPQAGIGKNTRVNFVVTVRDAEAKRAQQALLPSVCLERKAPLDHGFYVDALLKKLAPLLSVLFMADERATRITRDLSGKIIEVAPKRAADRARLLGEASAETALRDAMRRFRLLTPKADVQNVRADDGREDKAKKAKTEAKTGEVKNALTKWLTK